MEATLVLSSLGASVASGLFLAAGLNLQARRVAPRDQRAVDLFSLWWLGLAVYAGAGASQDLVAASGVRPFLLFLVLSYVQMVALCIGLWGLMYHVAYVVTGRRKLLIPLSAFYVAYYAAILFLVTRSLPHAVEASAWSTGLVYGDPVLDAFAIALLLAIPPLVGAGMYLLLSLQARETPQRLRILLVTGSTFAWSAAMLAREADLAALLPAILGILSGFSISWAYQPPAWLRRRLDTASS
jgi:hypothetical protein